MRYDYAVMIFILTFNLVAVYGLRADRDFQLASQRLMTIIMGFSVCIFSSLLIYPIWASDELHYSTSSKFGKLACNIEECFEEYFRVSSGKEYQSTTNINSCKSVLNSKSADESLANFARWEPWHGKFGFSYPWNKYLQIGETLGELAGTILSINQCLDLQIQPSTKLLWTLREPCEIVGLLLGSAMRELGDSIMRMKKIEAKLLIVPKLQSMKHELNLVSSASNLQVQENREVLAIAHFMFLLTGMVEKVAVLAKEVEELGEIAGFKNEQLVLVKN